MAFWGNFCHLHRPSSLYAILLLDLVNRSLFFGFAAIQSMAVAGVEVKPGEPYIHRPSAGRRLKICQEQVNCGWQENLTNRKTSVLATLGNCDEVGWSLLECSIGDKEPVKLCALNPKRYFICSRNGDRGHSIDKLTSKSVSPTCLKGEVRDDETDGKIHAPPKEATIVTGADDKNDTSKKEPIVSKADVKDDASPKEPIVSERDVKNDACPNEAIFSEASGKNDATLKEATVGEDGDDNEHLPIRVAFSKRGATEKRKSKAAKKEHMLSDQNNEIGQVNDQKNSEIMDSHIMPTQDQEITDEGNAVQCCAGTTSEEIRQGASPSTVEGFLFTGATELQGADPENKDAEHCGCVHAGKDSVKKITLDNGLTIEDLVMGKANAKTASSGRKVTVKCVCKLMDGRIVNPVDGNNIHKFKLGAGKVIRGLDLGVSGMRVGGKRKLTIPPALGHGDKAEGEIPANSWLVYEVELTEVKRCKKASHQPPLNPC
ncbi:hypothetical protein ACP70R_009099 [Stipagrostis hirtigluma subsp. patula]